MINSSSLRFLVSEAIFLDQEEYQQARAISNQVTAEAHKWEIYLNILALLGFEQWLSERIPQQQIHRYSNPAEAGCYLNIGDFKVCLIAKEQFIDELVEIPQHIIEQPEFIAHFYVVIEVLEEQGQIIIRGVLRYDQLINYRLQFNLQPEETGYYQLPLALFDNEPNHLLFYYRYLEPAAIPLPVPPVATVSSFVPLLESFLETKTRLSLWLEGIFDEGWQTIDALINYEPILAFNTRNTDEVVKRAKLIDLGVQLGDLQVALLVNITKESHDKLGILVQLHPTEGERYLPSDIKMTLLSKAGRILQEVTARSQDNYIQMKPFKGETGQCFCIKVSLEDLSVTENFEL